jgi:hypothetical protein
VVPAPIAGYGDALAEGTPATSTAGYSYDSMRPKPFRVPLFAFPDVVLHADELVVKRHSQYSAAKTGAEGSQGPIGPADGS